MRRTPTPLAEATTRGSCQAGCASPLTLGAGAKRECPEPLGSQDLAGVRQSTTTPKGRWWIDVLVQGTGTYRSPTLMISLNVNIPFMKSTNFKM